MQLPWMSRTDRRHWKSARTTAALGELMAQWLEGSISSRPGYTPRYGPEDETRPLVPTLAALCRAGYVTTCSQPGLVGWGADDAWWEQRAAVEGVVTDPVLLHRLVDAATTAGLLVRTIDYSRNAPGEAPIPVTTRNCETAGEFGGRISEADMAAQWRGLNPDLHDEVSHGTYVIILAPEYGPTGNRLWRILAGSVQEVGHAA
ncbi:DUF6919 domain-containing protein [Streptomyces cacaoi]|uniref:DUF6919 domain-containing protein n=1 Tax=Streptomyces cacaoi TaxID=1898 RepID=UPI0011F3EC2B|nr:hypothetical protein [Streptomyces cacaoi]